MRAKAATVCRGWAVVRPGRAGRLQSCRGGTSKRSLSAAYDPKRSQYVLISRPKSCHRFAQGAPVWERQAAVNGADSISRTAFAEEAQLRGTTRQQRLSSAHVLDGQAEVEQKPDDFRAAGLSVPVVPQRSRALFCRKSGLVTSHDPPRGSAGQLARGGGLAALNTSAASGRPHLPC